MCCLNIKLQGNERAEKKQRGPAKRVEKGINAPDYDRK